MDAQGSLAASPGDPVDHEVPEALHDDRSSSLSDLADGPDGSTGHEQSGGEDTEAETERIEPTPQKLHQSTHPWLTASSRPFSAARRTLSSDSGIESPTHRANGLRSLRKDSSLSSSSGSPYDHDESSYTGSKRKREIPGYMRDVDMEEPERKRSTPSKDEVNTIDEAARRNTVAHADKAGSHSDTIAEAPAYKVKDDARVSVRSPAKNSKLPKGKRKEERLNDPLLGEPIINGSRAGSVDPNPALSMEVVGEQGGLNEARSDEEDPSVSTKTEEELARGKSATDALTAIEKQFGAFRDKLYENRLSQLAHELELLAKPTCTHPEFLAQIQAVNARRNEKTQLEKVELGYRLKALRTKSRAERCQYFSQYFQTVREARDRRLEELGQQWYRINRERRQLQSSEPEFTCKFPTKRSDQILHQRAYNMEVSILSGIAKYVGFPAAPEPKLLQDTGSNEDLRNMRIKVRPQQPVYHFPGPSQAEQAAAEREFLERNAWANPQHPHHHGYFQPEQQRQGGLFSTPATAKQFNLSPAVIGTGSTIEAASGPPSSGGQDTSNPVRSARAYETVESPLGTRKIQILGRQTLDGASNAHSVDKARDLQHVPPSSKKRRTSAVNLTHPTLQPQNSSVNQAFPTSSIHISQHNQNNPIDRDYRRSSPRINMSNDDGRQNSDKRVVVASETGSPVKQEPQTERFPAFSPSLGQQNPPLFRDSGYTQGIAAAGRFGVR